MEYGTIEMEEPENLIFQTLEITAHQFVAYTKAVKCLKACPACGAQQWEFPTHQGRPALLMSNSVRDQSIADWHFQIICKNCGNNRLISAGYVWAHYHRPGRPA